MKLPKAERAVVDPAKIRDYLLSPEHPVGRAKARFFAALGFRRAEWPALRDALLVHALGEAELAGARRMGRSTPSVVSFRGRPGARRPSCRSGSSWRGRRRRAW